MRRLFNLIRRLAETRTAPHEQLTPMQGRMIGFIQHHGAGEVYQRDLERAFEIRRSTASTILQTMEKNGLIRRESVPHDARLKRVVLTPEAISYSKRFHQDMAKVEAYIKRGVTQEELASFFTIMAKFEYNLNEYLARSGEQPQPPCCGEGEQ